MHADSYYVIGDSHKVCQDYALHGVDSAGKPYIFLADGCSSAKDTDFGARILCHSAKMYEDEFFEENMENIFEHIRDERLDFDLPYEALYATLLGAKSKENGVISYLTGDGIVAGRKTDGTIEYSRVESPYSAPYYLMYDLENNGPKDYVEQFGNFIKQTDILIKPDGEICLLEEIFFPYDNVLRTEFDLDGVPDFEVMAIFSDGVTSFVDENKKPIHESIIIKELLDFKSTKGEFVHRRMTAALKKWKKMGWSHHDDLSMACIMR